MQGARHSRRRRPPPPRSLTAALPRSLTVSPAAIGFCFLQDFGLTIDIDSLIKQYDADGSGEIDYEEFREMLS